VLASVYGQNGDTETATGCHMVTEEADDRRTAGKEIWSPMYVCMYVYRVAQKK